MGDIIKFSSPRSEITDREEMAVFLERYAAKTRAGEIDAIAFAIVRSDGSMGTRWSNIESFDGYLLVSATAYLHHALLHSNNDE